MLIQLADVIQQKSGGFFQSASGVVILAVVSSIAGAFALFFFKGLPKIIGVLADIRELLTPTDTRKRGLIDLLNDIQTDAALLEQKVNDHIEISIRDLSNLRKDLRQLRERLDQRRTPTNDN